MPMSSSAVLSATCSLKVTQLPKDNTLSCNPDLPSRRYSISFLLNVRRCKIQTRWRFPHYLLRGSERHGVLGSEDAASEVLDRVPAKVLIRLHPRSKKDLVPG